METTTKATNAIEAKEITDNYLATLTPEVANDIFKDFTSDVAGLMQYSFNKAYEIGAGSYYYGEECKEFPNEVITRYIIEQAIAFHKK